MEFVCFKWKPATHYRSNFGPEHVNTLWKMLRRHYEGPARLTCVTDDPAGIDKEIRVMPLWKDHAKLASPHGAGNPSCYRRLRAWGAEAEEWFGPRFMTLDLDVVITGNLNPLVDVPEDFRIWGDTAKGTPYNGSLVLMTAGARRQVWDKFDPVKSPARGQALGYIGSDQAWIAACLGPNEKKWTSKDGVYSYRNEIQHKEGRLPAGARIVVFHGSVDPWSPAARARHDWVREHYR